MFFQNMAIAAEQVFILYVIVAVGFIADRLQLFSEKTARATTNLLFYIVTPSVIIRSFLSMEFTRDSAVGLLTVLLCNILTFAVAILISTPFYRNKEKKNNPVYNFASIYGNMGYMGLPLAQAILGYEGTFYGSAGIIAFNFYSFTHGIWLMSKTTGEKQKIRPRQLLVNPGIISFAVGLPLFLLSVSFPKIIMQPIEYIASLNTPLAMLILGTYISNANIKTVFKQKEHYMIILLKLIVLPLTMISIFRFVIGIKRVLLIACSIVASTPSANNTVMFAAKYGKDTGAASKAVAFVSFASIFTIPFMIALAMR